MSALLWLLRVFAVVALLGAAAALATPRGRLPLALRGLQRLVRQDRGEAPDRSEDRGKAVPFGRRLVALLLLLAAVAVAVL